MKKYHENHDVQQLESERSVSVLILELIILPHGVYVVCIYRPELTFLFLTRPNIMCDNHSLNFLFPFPFHQKKLRFSQNRPKTAPNAKHSFSKDNSFLTSSNLPPSLRPKKSNQVSPLIGETFSYINYDVACERQIRQGLKGGLINGIITISEMTGK